MAIEICSVGGYNEVGKNMTAIKVGDEAVIIDMGIFLPALIDYEGEDYRSLSSDQLIRMGAIPDDNVIADWKKNVKAIVVGHCHLDHLAAVPSLAAKYRAPIIGTPFTIEVLKSILKDEEIKLPNKLRPINPNSSVRVSDNIEIELINITHSTLQSTMVAVHTSEGVVLYSNDFKFDNYPIVGDKPNYKRLKELGKKGVKCLIVESLYATRDMKTPSEKVAKELLKDVMLGVDNTGHAVFVTTFASHLARIRSIIEFSKKLNRKIMFLGRSMGKYIKSAENAGLIKYSKEGRIYSYRSQAERALKAVEKNRGEYVVVCTGSQGEPSSILDKIVNHKLRFKFKVGDHVVFSCKTIPCEINLANREALESKLKLSKVRIFKEIHVSGHASREDLRDFIEMVKPEHIIPAHGENVMKEALANLCEDIGYKLGDNIHVMNDGDKIEI